MDFAAGPPCTVSRKASRLPSLPSARCAESLSRNRSGKRGLSPWAVLGDCPLFPAATPRWIPRRPAACGVSRKISGLGCGTPPSPKRPANGTKGYKFRFPARLPIARRSKRGRSANKRTAGNRYLYPFLPRWRPRLSGTAAGQAPFSSIVPARGVALARAVRKKGTVPLGSAGGLSPFSGAQR
jgi:hypothetical protein